MRNDLVRHLHKRILCYKYQQHKQHHVLQIYQQHQFKFGSQTRRDLLCHQGAFRRPPESYLQSTTVFFHIPSSPRGGRSNVSRQILPSAHFSLSTTLDFPQAAAKIDFYHPPLFLTCTLLFALIVEGLRLPPPFE